MSTVLQSYAPALVFIVLGAVIGILFSVLNTVLGSKRAVASKTDPYLFDIEVIFLYPIAVQLKAFGTFALVETLVFIFLLFVAFIYVWRRGALEWR